MTGPRDARDELDEELEFHRAATIEELIASGLTADAAAREADRRFGDRRRWRERILATATAAPAGVGVAARLGNAGASALRDLRYAWRLAARGPLFSLSVVGVFALGIAANTLIFALVHAVLLSPMPFPDADRLVLLWGRHPERLAGFTDLLASNANLQDWRKEARSFAAIGGVTPESQNLTTGGDPLRVSGVSATGDFFQALGVAPALGRLLRADDSREGAPRVAVIGDRLWRAHFNADPAIVGRTIDLDGRGFEVVGVMPPGFLFPRTSELSPVYGFDPDPQVYVAWGQSPFDSPSRGNFVFLAVGRIRGDRTLADAQAEMDRIAADLALRYPSPNEKLTIALTPVKAQAVARVARPLVVMAAAVGVVLVIACLNIVHLLIVRTSARTRELAVRAAIGATRGDLWRQAVIEALVLSCAGGLAGVLLAVWGLRAFRSLAPDRFPRLDALAIDGTVVLFAFGLMLASGVIVGAAGMVRLAGRDLQPQLRASAKSVAPGRGRARAIVVSEVALSAALLIGAGLIAKSFWQLSRVPSGLTADGVDVFHVSLPLTTYGGGRAWRTAFDRLVEELRAIDGVDTAGYTFQLPMGGTAASTSYLREDGSRGMALIHRVSPSYFDVMGIPRLRGAGLDTVLDLPAVLVNETLAREHFGGAEPVGRLIEIDGVKSRVAGVVGDVRHSGLEEPAMPEVYRRAAIWTMWVAVKARPGRRIDRAAIERAVRAVDPLLPVPGIETLQARIDASNAERRLTMWIMASVAGLAAALALVGLYAVTALLVAGRRREIALRIALGSTAGAVVRLVFRQTFVLAAVGLAAGAGAALAASRFLAPLLFGTSPRDPMVFASVVALLAVATGAAVYLPARRAAGTDAAGALGAD